MIISKYLSETWGSAIDLGQKIKKSPRIYHLAKMPSDKTVQYIHCNPSQKDETDESTTLPKTNDYNLTGLFLPDFALPVVVHVTLGKPVAAQNQIC
jgi:hypothetical protein